MLEAERHERHGQLLGKPVVHPLDDEFAQLVHAEVGGVDDEIGGLDDRVEQFALARDRLLQRLAGLRERMPTLRFAEPAQQFGVGGGHRQKFAAQTAAPQRFEGAR